VANKKGHTIITWVIGGRENSINNLLFLTASRITQGL
jgi:hypothetical protein